MGSVDAKVFAYLAPVLFVEPKLPVDTLAKVVRGNYGDLQAHLEKVKEQLFPNTTESLHWVSPAEALTTPPTLSGSEGSNAASSLWSYIWPFASSTSDPTAQKASSSTPSTFHTPPQRSAYTTQSRRESKKASASPSAKPEDRRIRLGRALWICSALIGLVGYTFASGIVSVKLVDNDGEEDEDEEDEEEEDEGG